MKILFIPYTIKSHVISTLGLASVLKKEGHQIHYVIDSDNIEFIKQYGYGAYPLSGFPFGFGFEHYNRFFFENSKDIYLDDLVDRVTNRIYKDRKIKLINLINSIKPDFVICDIFCCTDFIILYSFLKEHKVKFCFFQGTFCTIDRIGESSFDSHLSNNNKVGNMFDFFFVKLVFYLRSMINHFKFLGRGDYTIIKRNFNSDVKNKKKYFFRKNRITKIHFPNLKYLVLLNKELESSPKIPENHIYIGPMISQIKKSFTCDKIFENDFHFINQQKNKGKKIIYFSLGTVISNQKNNKVISLIERIILAFKNNDNFILLCSLGTLNENYNSVSNIYIYNYVAQTEVLNIADIFITHGGTGSIYEALEFNVPMIVYPFDLVHDHFGNAIKVKSLGIGLIGKPDSDRTEDILFLVDKTLEDISFKENIKKLKMQISKNQEYDKKNIIRTLENIEIVR